MLKQITSIIIDDEPDARDELERIITSEFENITVVNKASNARDGLEYIIDSKPDLIFLDIQMPEKDGFWLADKLRKTNLKSEIVFVTAYDEYAIDAIKFAAFDFITKPVNPVELRESVERFVQDRVSVTFNQKLETLSYYFNRERIKFNNHEGFVMISPEDIVYCQAEKNYTKIYLTSGINELVTCQLGIVQNKLPDNHFIRISRSNLVNVAYIGRFSRKTKLIELTTTLLKTELKVSSSGVKRLQGI